VSNNAINERQIARYLLGQAPPDESERLDELCFIDDDFSARLQISEDDLIDAYARGKLGGEEQKQFERKYLAVPYLRERVRFAKVLSDIIKEEPVPPQSQVEESPSWLEKVLRHISWSEISFRPLLTTAAATLFLGIAILSIHTILRNQDHAEVAEAPIAPTPIPDPSPVTSPSVNVTPQATTPPVVVKSNPAVFLLSAGTRDSTNSQSFVVPRKIEKVIFRLSLKEVKYARYRVVLKTRDETPVWTSGEIAPIIGKLGGTLNVTIPADKLAPRTYIITLTGLNTGPIPTEEYISEYSCRIIR
jgi:hypothetical protein